MLMVVLQSSVSCGGKTCHPSNKPACVCQGPYRHQSEPCVGSTQGHVFVSDSFDQTIISTEVLYCMGTAAFKFSALLLFHRIFGLVRRFTVLLWAMAFVVAANNIAEIFLSIFQCTPVHKAWDQGVAGSCVNILLAACIPGAINVFTDFAIVLLPIPMVWRLQMGRSRKIQLVGVFLLSSL